MVINPLQSYRITNVLWNQGSQVLPLALQSFISEGFAVDIHPSISSMNSEDKLVLSCKNHI